MEVKQTFVCVRRREGTSFRISDSLWQLRERENQAVQKGHQARIELDI